MRVWDHKKPQVLDAIRKHRHRKAQREAMWKSKHHRGSKHHSSPAGEAADAEKGLGASNSSSLSSSEQGPAALDLDGQDNDQENQDLQDLTLIHGSLNYNTIDQVLGKCAHPS